MFFLHLQLQKNIEQNKNEEYNTRQTYLALSPLEQKSLCSICQHRTLRYHRLPAQGRCRQFAIEAEGCGNRRTCRMLRRQHMERRHQRQGDGYRYPAGK